MTETSTTDLALANLIASLADNKYFLGRRYAEWCTAAPTLESAVAAAAMAQDEIGHARSFYPLLRDVAGVSPETEAETRSHWTCAPFLRDEFRGWTDFIAANFLFDTALTVLLESAAASSFAPLGQRARRILEEEPLHWLHGEGWTLRLAATGGGVKVALQTSLSAIEPQVASLFDVAAPDLVARGVLESTPAQLADRVRARVNPILEKAGLRWLA